MGSEGFLCFTEFSLNINKKPYFAREFRKVVLLHTLKCETMPCMGKGSQSHGNMMLNSFSVLPPLVRVSSESCCCFLVIRQ